MKRFQFSRYLLTHAADIRSLFRLYMEVRRGPRDVEHSLYSVNVRHKGKTWKLWLRRGTTDVNSYAETFCEEIYRQPTSFPCKVILDLGANIGIASIWMSTAHPGAAIYSFEPVPGNFAMLTRNITANNLQNNVRLFSYGWMNQDRTVELRAGKPGEFWSYSSERDGQTAAPVRGSMRRAGAVMHELGLDRVDFMKIDIEGAELEVLEDIRDRLPSIRCIAGELHEECDPSRFLALLGRTHQVDFKKDYGQRTFCFRAMLRDSSAQAAPRCEVNGQ